MPQRRSGTARMIQGRQGALASELVRRDLGAQADEAWIMGSTQEHAIRVRNLSTYLKQGGSLREVRLVEAIDGGWTVWVRLASRPGEYRLNIYKSDQPKIYRDVSLAIATCRKDFGYFGPISVATEKQPGDAVGQPSKDADLGEDDTGADADA
jgi:hypothetical protein